MIFQKEIEMSFQRKTREIETEQQKQVTAIVGFFDYTSQALQQIDSMG